MGLLDEIRTANKPKRLPCGMLVLLDRLLGDDRADLTVALADPAIKHSTIVEVLSGRGFEVKQDTVSRHRRGLCSCDG